MTDIFLLPALTLITAMFSLITAKDVLFTSDEKPKQSIFRGARKGKKLATRGYILIILAIITIVLSYWQQATNKKEIEKTNLLNEKKLKEANELSLASIERSKNETIEALARFGLKYDSTNGKMLNYLKDSANVLYKASVGICLDEKSFTEEGGNDDFMEYKIHICNYGQDLAYNFKLGIGALIKKSTGFIVNKLVRIPAGVRISSNTSYPVRVQVTNYNQGDTLYLFLKGTYSGADNNLEQSVTEIFRYRDQSRTLELQDDKSLLKHIRNISFKL